MKGARDKPKSGLMFNVQQQPMLVSYGASLIQKPQLDTMTERYQGGRKSAGGHLPVSLTPIQRGAMGDSLPEVLLSMSSLPSSSSLEQVGTS